jgi:Ser/Thr protein kinase RdoA (MazF antagonist)
MNEEILCQAMECFALQQDRLEPVESHEGGRNLVFRCEGEAGTRYLRLSCMNDRDLEDYLSETEFVHYLAQQGAPVADALPSVNGRLVEVFETSQGTVYASLFEEAVGDQLAARGYRYREGVPLSEYFFNCGKCLGRIHTLSQQYEPSHPRYDYTRRFNMAHFAEVTPPQYVAYLPAIERALEAAARLDKSAENYGVVHFDFSDGNYMIDYSNGDINVFDFENCCRCWYLYDLANLWIHGVGWIQFEPDVDKRRAFMEWYFAEVLRGYRSETTISDADLSHLQEMIRLVLVENVLDEFENAEDEDDEEDDEILYRLRCIAEEVPYWGFFSDIYTVGHPFAL